MRWAPAATPRVVPAPALARWVLLAMALSWGWSLFGAAPAGAETGGDEITSFSASYDVQPSGAVQVQEQIDYRFGSSGRHGIDRQYVTREPWDESDSDAVYTYSDIEVSSPSGAPADVAVSSDDDGRDQKIRVRIGDPNRTVVGTTASYVISYTLQGALREQEDFDELYWDVSGFDAGTAPIAAAEVTVDVPGGVQQTSCFAGPVGSEDTCESAVADGTATYRAADLVSGEGITIGAAIGSGEVQVAAPDLQPNADRLTPQERRGAIGIGALGLVSVVGSPVLGTLWWRRRGRDDRWADLPPGTSPARGEPARVDTSAAPVEIPVAFSPPKVPVAEAGLLIDGTVDTVETSATLVDLAVRGVLEVEETSSERWEVVLLDPSKTSAPHENVLLNGLFGGRPPGARRSLSAQGAMSKAHDAMAASVRHQVAERRWFHRLTTAPARQVWALWLPVVLIGFFVFRSGSLLGLLMLVALPLAATLVVLGFKRRRGRRTAAGRAVCDQAEGFRTYLATAEAEQLRFEEGEDVFSRYLPWAIVFNLTERWSKICRDLVAAGRLSEQPPTWYRGSSSWMYFNAGLMANSFATAATPAPPPPSASSGTGFGGGSSFGGGGFSGGGGGGGGTSSW